MFKSDPSGNTVCNQKLVDKSSSRNVLFVIISLLQHLMRVESESKRVTE